MAKGWVMVDVQVGVSMGDPTLMHRVEFEFFVDMPSCPYTMAEILRHLPQHCYLVL